jgi:hypothetical protein
MNSRFAISALFILIAGMVIASQGTGLLEKLKVLQASCANKISEVRTLPISHYTRTIGNPPRAAGTISPDHHLQFSQYDTLSGFARATPATVRSNPD